MAVTQCAWWLSVPCVCPFVRCRLLGGEVPVLPYEDATTDKVPTSPDKGKCLSVFLVFWGGGLKGTRERRYLKDVHCCGPC